MLLHVVLPRHVLLVLHWQLDVQFDVLVQFSAGTWSDDVSRVAVGCGSQLSPMPLGAFLSGSSDGGPALSILLWLESWVLGHWACCCGSTLPF